MEFQELVRQFAKEAGIDDIERMITDGMCVLDFGRTSVTLAEHGETNTLVMCAEIAPVPDGGRTELSQMMMKEMFANGVPRGTIFSIDASSGNFHLHRCDHLGSMDPESFGKTVTDFVAAVETWRNRVTEFQPEMETDGLSNADVIRA